GVKPKPERISWAVEQQMRNRFPGVLIVAREKKALIGVALAVYAPSAELGRVLVIQDFFVDPALRRKGVGRALAGKLLEEAKAISPDSASDPWNPFTSRKKSMCRSISEPFGTRSRPWVSSRMWNRLPLCRPLKATRSKGSRFGPYPRVITAASIAGSVIRRGRDAFIRILSIVVGDRRGDEGIAERAFELRADVLDTDPHAGLDAD